ncbi:hypothetical protein [Gordonia sp. NPDC003376]
MTAHVTAYTYITPMLTDVVGFGSTTVAAALLAYGVMGIIGNVAGGEVSARRAQLTMTVLVVTVCASVLVIPEARAVSPAVIAVLVVWALVWGAVPVGVQMLLVPAAEYDGHPVEAAQTASSSLFQLSIGLGALFGGIATNVSGARGAFLVSAVLAVLAVTVVVGLGRLNRRMPVWT